MIALVCCALWSVAAPGQQVRFRSYRQADGLINLSVPCLLQRRNGDLWVCTENGVERFDGIRFERIGEERGLTSSRFYAIAEDDAGSVWLGAPTELLAGSGQQFKPIRYRGRALPIGIGSQLASLSGERMLILSGEQLYIATVSKGGHRDVQPYFDKLVRAANPALAKLTAVHSGRDDTIWLGCGVGICRIANGRVQQFGTVDGVPAGEWRALLMDRSGRLWARSFEHFIVMTPGQTRFAPAGAPGMRLTTAVPFVSIVEDRAGRIVTRADEGLLRWTPGRAPDLSWERFGPMNGLPSAYSLSLVVDDGGSLWIGSGGGGLLRWLGYENWQGFTSAQGLASDVVWSVARDSRGRLIAGTSNGCSVLDETRATFSECSFAGDRIEGEINAIVPTRDGGLWISSMAGAITQVDAKGKAQSIAMLPYVRTIWRDAADVVWFMTYRGVFKVGPGARVLQPVPVRIPGAEEADFSDATEDQAGIHWFASVKGLFQYQSGQWRRGQLPPTSPGKFRSVAIGRTGELWAASTGRGLLRADYDRSGIRRVEWIDEPMVAGAAISTVRADHRGWIWLATDQGLMLFDRRTWRRFNEADGLIWNDMNQTASFFDTDGSLWMGTTNGLAQLHNPARLVESKPLDARLDDISLGGQALSARGVLEVTWRRESIFNVRFVLRDFDETGGAIFRYRLHPLEAGWTTTTIPEARYSSLPPGRFRFEMQVLQPDHQRASPIASASFVILPPWWQTIWFRAIIVIALLIMLVLLVRFSERRLRRQKQDLQNDLEEREALLQRATRDSLTGLWNRPAILDRLEGELPGAPRTPQCLAIAMIDIDHFKAVNDTYGHVIGDAVLRRVAQELAGQVRATDHIGRYGGEELLVVLPGLAHMSPNLAIEKLCRGIRAIDFGDISSKLRITASIGVAWLRPGDSVEQLVARADIALYAAKSGGRDRVIYASETKDVLHPFELRICHLPPASWTRG